MFSFMYSLEKSEKRRFKGYKIGTFRINDLITKDNNGLIRTCLDLLTF